MSKVYRGEIWYYESPQRTWKFTREDSVQNVSKPVMIVGSDIVNASSTFILVAPCSYEPELQTPTHLKFELNGRVVTAFLDRVICVAQENLKRKLGDLPMDRFDSLDSSIAYAFGITLVQKQYDVIKERQRILDKYSDMYSVDAIDRFKERLMELRNDCNVAINAYNEQLQIHEDLLKLFPKVSKVMENNPNTSKGNKEKSSDVRRQYVKRSSQDKMDFVQEWSSATALEKERVAAKYNMSIFGARSCYNRWSKGIGV